jgi:YVTN family beta-propeller protein
MKKIKYILYGLIIIALTIILIGFIVRYPSYTIQTTGKLYIINKKSEDVTVFDLHSGKELATVAINIESHGAAKVVGQDKIAIANYNTTKDRDISICILNTKTNTVEKTIAFKEDALGLDGVIALPQSNRIAVMSSISNTFLTVDMKSETIDNKIPTLQKKSHHIALHPSQPIAYITNIESGSISVINYATSQIMETISCGKGTQSLDITADGSEIWVTNSNENTIGIIDPKKNKLIQKIKTGNEPMGLKFSVDGRYCLVTNLKDGYISVFNRLSKKEIKKIPIHGKSSVLERTLYHTPRPVNIIMHPNGLYAFIANSNANKIEIIDMKTFTIVSTIGTGNVPDSMIFVQ